MEKYQKLVSLVILFAFFAAISFYIQRASEALDVYVTDLFTGGNMHVEASKILLLWAMDFLS
jgi:hypothetical protein